MNWMTRLIVNKAYIPIASAKNPDNIIPIGEMPNAIEITIEKTLPWVSAGILV
jgi:hypothetical protein